MKKYIGLLLLCFLSNITMEKDSPKDHVTLVASDGGEVLVAHDIAEKIPLISKVLGRENTIMPFGEVVGSQGTKGFESKRALQSVVDIVKNVYTNAPILKEAPQFFEAYAPSDIPQQVRSIIDQHIETSGIDKAVLSQAARYLGLIGLIRFLVTQKVKVLPTWLPMMNCQMFLLMMKVSKSLN